MKKSEKLLLVAFAILFAVIVGGGLLTFSLKSYRSITEGNEKLRHRRQLTKLTMKLGARNA